MNTETPSAAPTESIASDTSQAFPPPTALILLASEQLWPNVESVEYWKDSLQHIFIYHTEDERRSVLPAQRLGHFCQARCPHVQVDYADGDGKPESVVAKIEGWLVQYPQYQWVINATGGTKLMFLGAASLIGRPHVSVIYRELNGSWYHLTNHNGYLETLPLDIPPQVTDRIPLETLLQTLWWDEGTVIDLRHPKPLDIVRLTQLLIQHEGKWREAFTACGVPPEKEDNNSGHLFERYVAAILLAIGVPPQNIARNVRKEGKQSQQKNDPKKGGQHLHEIDIVVNHQSRIYVLDCKLQGEGNGGGRGAQLMQQIRNLSDTVRQLGGVGAVGVLLRPNRTFFDEERTYAEGIGLRVLDRSKLSTFFEELARILGIPTVPAVLQNAQQLWQNPVFAERVFPGSPRTHQIARSSSESGIVGLENYLCEWSRTLGQNWAVCQLWDNYFLLRYDQRKGQGNIHQIARHLPQNIGCINSESEQLWTSGTGDTGYWLFQANPEDVRRFFKPYVGRDL
ncbi:PDDEXK family nuclease [Thermogemmata fonticola]|uniref:Card1 CARF domain-containing protein n=1 Tax=Thermogemmata fonticola TaxID=2755323 RepID=A0A7V8VGG0_9BACT|nr:hypothetical protein [Thermogemmata fonticola]MBA2227594.1 hypothetical protein [Thermogemmata fonticola]